MGCQISIPVELPAEQTQAPIYAQTVKEVSPIVEVQGTASIAEPATIETDRSHVNMSQQST